MFTLTKLLQPPKAALPILVTLWGDVYTCNFCASTKCNVCNLLGAIWHCIRTGYPTRRSNQGGFVFVEKYAIAVTAIIWIILIDPNSFQSLTVSKRFVADACNTFRDCHAGQFVVGIKCIAINFGDSNALNFRGNICLSHTIAAIHNGSCRLVKIEITALNWVCNISWRLRIGVEYPNRQESTYQCNRQQNRHKSIFHTILLHFKKMCSRSCAPKHAQLRLLRHNF